MNTKIIAVANQKGGCGKTTITMQIAGALGKENFKVLVVDADPQGTATRWAANADEDMPFPATICGLSIAGNKVHREVKKYIGIYEYIIVDCPPAVESHITQSALLIADLIIIPLIPSPADLWAAVGIEELIERTKDLNENLNSRIVINMCQHNTNLTQEVLKLVTNFGIQQFNTKICLRTSYRQSAVFGSTIFDIKEDKKAIEEISSLKNEILSLLNR